MNLVISLLLVMMDQTDYNQKKSQPIVTSTMMVWSTYVNNTLVLSPKKMNGEMLTVQNLLIFIVNVHLKPLIVKEAGLVMMLNKFLLNFQFSMMKIIVVPSILKMILNLLIQNYSLILVIITMMDLLTHVKSTLASQILKTLGELKLAQILVLPIVIVHSQSNNVNSLGLLVLMFFHKLITL